MHTWVRAFVLGAIVGAAAGVGSSLVVLSRPIAKGSALFHGFSFQEVTKQAGHPDWEILEDKTYSPFPALGESKRTARRIVAQTVMSDEQLEAFSGRFKHGIDEALERFGAQKTGGFNCNRSTVRPAGGGGPTRSELQLPRYYYRLEARHGVADTWLIAQGGEVTVIVCLTE
ncbi:MAG: hypothetical protein ACRC1K_02415 [Planctomycetia bacterium]